MANVWRISKKGEREQIEVDLFDYWYDGKKWKVMAKHGIETFRTKAQAYQFAVDCFIVSLKSKGE